MIFRHFKFLRFICLVLGKCDEKYKGKKIKRKSERKVKMKGYRK